MELFMYTVAALSGGVIISVFWPRKQKPPRY